MENFLMFLRCKREKLQKLWLMSKWTFLFVFLGIINTHGTVPERATGYNLYEECLFEGYFMGDSATNHVCFHVS